MEDPNASFVRQAGETSAQNNMVVAVRVRPLSPKEEAAGCQACCKVINKQIVVISKSGNPAHYLRSQQGTINEYGFDAAFDAGTSQAEVYEKTAKRHVPSVLEGRNVTVFAYGATGAGKTHTMMGSERSGESTEQDHMSLSGIIPQSLVDIFAQVNERKQRPAAAEGKEAWKVYASFLEVYNEQIYDLIAGGRLPLAVREDSQRGVVQVAGLSEIEVSSTSEVLELLRQGNRNRKTESTAANVVSSRSHAVLQVMLRYAGVDSDGNDLVRESKLSLIDLAGSERASATQNRGMRLHEGANINKSLLALANCINALAENNGKMRRNVKYRDSKLTHLLKTSLEGDCKLIMIANINPSHHVFEDSHNTLKYANRAKNIKIKAGTAHLLTQEVPSHVREARLRADNEKLRYELDYLRQCLSKGGVTLPPTAVPAHSEGDASLLDEAANHSLNTSGAGSGSFLSMRESMEIDEQSNTPGDDSLVFQQPPARSNHDGRRRSMRRTSQLIPLNSPPAVVNGAPAAEGRGKEMEDMMLEMTRTREFMQSLIENLNNQKAQTEAELQAQRVETQLWQRRAQEKDQEIAKLREQVVQLRTRLEQVAPWGVPSPMMGGGGAGSSSAVADAMDLQLSPINPPGGSAASEMGPSAAAVPTVNPLVSPSGAKKASRRRMSQIPRYNPTAGGSNRRTSLMPPTAGKFKDDAPAPLKSAGTPAPTVGNSQESQMAIVSSGKKRPRSAWATNTMETGEKENKTARTNRRESMFMRGGPRQSLLPSDGVAQRTRSRQSMLPPPSERFCF